MLASIRSFAKQLQAVPPADLTENLYVAHAASDCPTHLSKQNLRILISIKSENIYEVKFGDRATAYSGEILLADIVSSELRERRPKSRTVISGALSCCLMAKLIILAVSTKVSMRDALDDLLWQNRRSNIDIMYPDYQP